MSTSYGAPQPLSPPASPERPAGRVRRRVLTGTGVAFAFLVGVLLGSSGESDPTTSTQYLELQSEVTDIQADLAEAQAGLTDVETERDDLIQAQDDAQVERDDLIQTRDDALAEAADARTGVEALAADRADLEEREDALAAQSEDLEQREAQLDASITAVTAREDAVETAEAQVTPRRSTTPPTTDVYYQNCDAARAAGAAPVLRGEPGYGRHLDRDNDGIGCE